MKQLLPLFLLLLPYLAWAQYPSNGNQKITLGEQTTADGLIWRGVAATDTVRKPSIDTMAYMVLDTTTNIMWHYKKATSNAWLRLNLLPSDTASMLTNYWRAGRFSGVLPLLNGGTGSATQNFVDLTTTQTVAGEKTFNNNIKFKDVSNGFTIAQGTGGNTGYSGFWHNSVNLDQTKYNLITNGSTLLLNSQTTISLAINDSGKLNARSFGADVVGDFGIGVNPPTQKLHVVGNARITAMNGIGDIGADANGVLQAATSDINLKNTIENSPFGLNEILLLNPVTFLYNDTDRKIDSDVKEVGFIAQDVFDIIPNAVSSTGTGDLQLDYRAITATLTKAIQEQNAIIKALEQRIINLENK